MIVFGKNVVIRQNYRIWKTKSYLDKSGCVCNNGHNWTKLLYLNNSRRIFTFGQKWLLCVGKKCSYVNNAIVF